MVIFYQPKDMMSFASYILSDLRRDVLSQKFTNISDEELHNRCNKVTEDDLMDWMTIMESSADDTR